MNWAVAAKAAFGVSMAVVVFGSGLGARFSDVAALLRRRGLLARSLIAVLVIAPMLAVALVRIFDLNHEVAIALVALAVSPLPPLWLSKPIEKGQRWLLPIAMVVLLISAAPQMFSLIGNQTLAAIGIFAVASFIIGHLLGGPDRRDATVLAFATSCRHPATALVLASANFPNTDEHAAVALYGLVTAVIGAGYTLWFRRHRAVAG